MSLAEAVSRLAKGIRMQLRDLDEEDSKSYGSTPRTLDLHAFNAVIGQVTEWAINRVTEDWEVCKQAISTDTNQQLASEQCECELLLRFSLPCKHHLLHACATGIPIPRSLFHPRWWLNSPAALCPAAILYRKSNLGEHILLFWRGIGAFSQRRKTGDRVFALHSSGVL